MSAMVNKAGARVSTKEPLELAVRLLGIAISKIGVYGKGHPASRNAAEEAFVACQELVSLLKTAEFSADRQKLVVNGESVEPAAGQLLAMHIERHKAEGFRLEAPLDAKDFLEFVTLMGSSPQHLESSGGLAGAVKGAGLKSIQTVQSHYARNSGGDRGASAAQDASAAPRSVEADPAKAADRTPASAQQQGSRELHVLDIPADLTLEEMVQQLSGSSPVSATSPSSTAVSSPSADSIPREVQNLKAMVRKLQGLSESLGQQGSAARGAEEQLIGQLKEGVSALFEGTRARIESVAEAANADRQAVAEIEAQARSRGVPLRTTRDELLRKLAEIVQELRQPLTVASGVVDMMLGGNLDAITENQREMLRLAADSMDSAAQLTTHITELVGMPAGLHPDRAVLDEAYA